MTIELACPGCKTQLRLPDEMGGMRAKCVQCGAVLNIPSPTEHFWPPGAKQAARAPADSQPAARVAEKSSASASPPSTSVRWPAPGSQSLPARPAALTETARLSTAQTTTIPKMAAVTHGAESNGADARRAAVALRPVVIPDGRDSHGAAHQHHSNARIRIDDVLARAWGIYTTNLRALVGVGTILCLVTGGITLAVLFFLHALPVVVQLLVIQAVHVWLVLGITELTIRIARGRHPGIAVLLDGIPLYLAGLASWTVCFVPLALAALLCGQMGISPIAVAAGLSLAWTIVGFMIWIPSLLVLVDQEPNPIRALRLALGYAKRNAAPMAGFLAISLGVLVASIVPAGLGLPLGIPFVLLLCTVAYLRIARSGDETR